SSRRRHTRFSRDWSSDVCSSDLQRVRLAYDDAVQRVRQTLKDQGFGVLTEIDMTATLRDKIGVDIGRRYMILGACNPQLAHRARSEERRVGKESSAKRSAYDRRE